MIQVGDYVEAYTPVREDEMGKPRTCGEVEAVHESAMIPGHYWVKLIGNDRLIPDDRIMIIRKQKGVLAA